MDKLGATGKFPEGQITGDDEGELQFMLGRRSGNVVIDFGKDVSWLAMNPDTAIRLGHALIAQANRIK